MRYDVSFHADCCCDQALRTLTGGTLEEGEKTAEKFCVVVKTADQTQSLWELAKSVSDERAGDCRRKRHFNRRGRAGDAGPHSGVAAWR